MEGRDRAVSRSDPRPGRLRANCDRAGRRESRRYQHSKSTAQGRAIRFIRSRFFATIQRVRKLTGEEALGWKLAKARYLLTSDNKQRDSAEAVFILRSLIGQSQDTPEYRVLLAAGLINLGDTKGEIDHLKAAVERDPAGVDTMLDLIKLLLAQNRADEARSYLDRAAKSTGLTPANRRPLAVLLAQQGQLQQALSLLEPVADLLDVAGKQLYAELLRRRGDASGAEAVYTKLLTDPNVTADAIASAADFLASTDHLEDAKQALAKLADGRFPSTQLAAHGAIQRSVREQRRSQRRARRCHQ